MTALCRVQSTCWTSIQWVSLQTLESWKWTMNRVLMSNGTGSRTTKYVGEYELLLYLTWNACSKVPIYEWEPFSSRICLVLPCKCLAESMFSTLIIAIKLTAVISRYDIEPFFFSSSLNWIPSRFQEDARPNTGDRMSIIPACGCHFMGIYRHNDYSTVCTGSPRQVSSTEFGQFLHHLTIHGPFEQVLPIVTLLPN